MARGQRRVAPDQPVGRHDALRNRATDLITLGVFLTLLLAVLGLRLNRLAGQERLVAAVGEM